MYGYNPKNPKMHILNYYILVGKRHIFLQWIEFKPPSFDHFLEFVKRQVNCAKINFIFQGAKGQISFTMEASRLLTVNGYSLTYVCVQASLVILYYVSSVVISILVL